MGMRMPEISKGVIISANFTVNEGDTGGIEINLPATGQFEFWIMDASVKVTDNDVTNLIIINTARTFDAFTSPTFGVPKNINQRLLDGENYGISFGVLTSGAPIFGVFDTATFTISQDKDDKIEWRPFGIMDNDFPISFTITPAMGAGLDNVVVSFRALVVKVD